MAASGGAGSINDPVGFIWAVADLLRGDYKQSEYGRVILPLTVIRRLDCVLADTKDAVIARNEALAGKVADPDQALQAVAGREFYNNVFARSLLADLPTPPGDGGLDLGSDVELTHLRIEVRGTVDAAIGDNDTLPLDPFPGGGGPSGDPEVERLSAIVDRLNDKYGYQLTITDALLFEQFRGDWEGDDELVAAAKANTFENFMIPFAQKFMAVVLGRMDANAEIFQAILDDTGFADDLKTSYGRDLYRQLNDD